MSKPVILTGLRANNDLHIGNYFGAILPMVDMAKTRSGEYDINMFIPDLHSFTTPIDHAQLQDQVMNNVRLFAAAGLPLDQDSIRVYRQSYVPAHSELTWILDCFTGFGQMKRMTQFKDKSLNVPLENSDLFEDYKKVVDYLMNTISVHPASITSDNYISTLRELLNKAVAYDAEFRNTVSIGLFNYPVLMAADILLYGANYVPVGDDQTQHLEFTRDISQKMNSRFGDLFVVPEPTKRQHEFFGNEQGLRIKDLIDPTKKMSKSNESERGVIFLSESPEDAVKKVMGATTDSVGSIHLDHESQPGISNLIQILALLTGRELEEVASEWEGNPNYGDFKKAVADSLYHFLKDFQTRLAEVNEEELIAKLAHSEQTINKVANATLLRAQQAVGLRPKAN